MADYGRPLEFGFSLAPQASDLDVIVDTAAAADGGLDLVGVQDHPYQRRFLDTILLLGVLAERTEHLRVFPDVACLPLRPPAMLANEAASIDIMSEGRFELGLGAGSFWDAIVGMDGPKRAPGESLDALEEAVAVIRLLWSGERGLRFDGEHYSLAGVHSGPLPVHDIEIWFGVYGPRACRLLGRVADGWIPSLGRFSLEDLDSRHRMIDEAAEESGRDPAAIRRLVNIGGVITDGDVAGPWDGPSEQWIDHLTDLTINHGFDTFILWPQDNPVHQVRSFIEVAAAVRESVTAERRPTDS
jgi:alkanesulfonate monooxygenase SsuD/methylene tetrahydromethanopterin reductase-like flavin-dependent oxidoreductase (luciferase family)